MRGKIRSVSLARRLVIDLMHASVPLVAVTRTMNLKRLVEARATLAERPGWAPLIIKAYAILARDEQSLRSYYLKWPWPHFYELPKTIATIAISRDDIGKDALVFLKIGEPDTLSLTEIDTTIRRGKIDPIDSIPFLKRTVRVARLPLPLRRIIWALALNIGRHRANNFGTFSITSIASLGAESALVRVPGPCVLTYGVVNPDHTMNVLFHWDHRIYDGILAARSMKRLEEVLNGVIADELLAGRPLKSLSAKSLSA
jgi:hypothetical protein